MTCCLILAAGEGTRLRPLTYENPKSLISFLGKPLISYQINNLETLGIKKIGIVTGYKAEKFNSLNYQKFFNKFFDNTNMVESLFAARTFLEQAKSDILISYGDIAYNKKNLKSVLETRGDIVVMVDDGWLDLWSLRNTNPLLDAETLKYNKKGHIIELGKRPKSLFDIEGQYTGLIKISCKKLNDFISFYDQVDRSLSYEGRTFKQMYMTTFLQLLIDSGWIVTPAHVNHGWLEIDTIEDLKIFEALHSRNELNNLWNANE
jgi:choline kinase